MFKQIFILLLLILVISSNIYAKDTNYDIVLLIDASGSAFPFPFPTQAVKNFVYNLGNLDRVTIIGFSKEVNATTDNLLVKEDKKLIRREFERKIQFGRRRSDRGNRTDILAGFNKAYSILSSRGKKYRRKRKKVILFISDGVADPSKTFIHTPSEQRRYFRDLKRLIEKNKHVDTYFFAIKDKLKSKCFVKDIYEKSKEKEFFVKIKTRKDLINKLSNFSSDYLHKPDYDVDANLYDFKEVIPGRYSDKTFVVNVSGGVDSVKTEVSQINKIVKDKDGDEEIVEILGNYFDIKTKNNKKFQIKCTPPKDAQSGNYIASLNFIHKNHKRTVMLYFKVTKYNITVKVNSKEGAPVKFVIADHRWRKGYTTSFANIEVISDENFIIPIKPEVSVKGVKNYNIRFLAKVGVNGNSIELSEKDGLLIKNELLNLKIPEKKAGKLFLSIAAAIDDAKIANYYGNIKLKINDELYKEIPFEVIHDSAAFYKKLGTAIVVIFFVLFILRFFSVLSKKLKVGAKYQIKVRSGDRVAEFTVGRMKGSVQTYHKMIKDEHIKIQLKKARDTDEYDIQIRRKGDVLITSPEMTNEKMSAKYELADEELQGPIILKLGGRIKDEKMDEYFHFEFYKTEKKEKNKIKKEFFIELKEIVPGYQSIFIDPLISGIYKSIPKTKDDE